MIFQSLGQQDLTEFSTHSVASWQARMAAPKPLQTGRDGLQSWSTLHGLVQIDVWALASWGATMPICGPCLQVPPQWPAAALVPSCGMLCSAMLTYTIWIYESYTMQQKACFAGCQLEKGECSTPGIPGCSHRRTFEFELRLRGPGGLGISWKHFGFRAVKKPKGFRTVEGRKAEWGQGLKLAGHGKGETSRTGRHPELPEYMPIHHEMAPEALTDADLIDPNGLAKSRETRNPSFWHRPLRFLWLVSMSQNYVVRA